MILAELKKIKRHYLLPLSIGVVVLSCLLALIQLTCTSQQKLDTNFKYYLSINLISVQYGASFATFLSG